MMISRSVTSCLTVPTNRSAWQLARGLCGGIFTTSMPTSAMTASNEVVNWPARSRMKNLKLSVPVVEGHEQIPGLLGGPCPVGSGCGAEDVHVAGGHFHHEEHLHALERERAVDVEEVARQQAGARAVAGAVGAPVRRAQRDRPTPAAGGGWSGAVRRPRVVTPAVRHPWLRTIGREAPANHRAGRRSGRES